MGNLIIDILKDNNHAKKKHDLLDFMDKFKLKSQFNENTTKVEYQLDHIWANVLRNECKYGVIKAYWSYFQKLIHIAFKLPNTFSMYIKKTINISICLKCMLHFPSN
jgi:hypothetical protein